MATRHQVRQCVVSLLYAKEMGSQMEQFSDEFLEEKKIRNDQKNFTISLYNGVLDNLDNIDNLLNSYLGKWKLDQIGIVERQILRLGAYEMKYSDIDLAIAINEAVILANELASESSIKLINGVLDAIAKDK
ncbi:transcription antitermination factor NusB [Campylobacter lanienae]|uniref:transcription antitermination factor NusB n=1 Tax=Campylobacter lanienae TaxID=75658 RepID=UPI000BB43031|nr:transcription antitermination factor NusB [Campylobacter lanienae]MCI5540072.1 transcription antitermination factor NusB [Campylobacter lanienae]MCI7364494.1 transcription antitermination factor NusB [Campylobacter lanienae]TWO15092.1 transcription antitermination factor NusB [Campylobacter lanienae]